MSSFKYCMQRNGNLLSGYERKTLREAIRAYRKEGYKAELANVSAVEDIIRDLNEERADIISQIKDSIPNDIDLDTVIKKNGGGRWTTE
jgi:hypothetical protein